MLTKNKQSTRFKPYLWHGILAGNIVPGIISNFSLFLAYFVLKGSGHYWQLLKIIISIKPYLATTTSYGERLMV